MRHQELFPIIWLTITSNINPDLNWDDDSEAVKDLCIEHKDLIETATEQKFIDKVISEYESIFSSNQSETN
jgi:hypothetical protein